MDSPPIFPATLVLPGQEFGYVANGGAKRYMLEAESTTGFVAWKLADGTTVVSQAAQVSLRESPHVTFWSCLGYVDATPGGHITYFDCHGNDLTALDVTHLANLEYLDCSFNRLTELPLSALTDLQVLIANNNRLTSLEIRHLKNLRILNWSNNLLLTLDCSTLQKLQVLNP